MWKHLKSKISFLRSPINSKFLIIQFGLGHCHRKAFSGTLQAETMWEIGVFCPLKTFLRTVTQIISTRTVATLKEGTSSLPEIYESSSGQNLSSVYKLRVSISRNKWKGLIKNNPRVQIPFVPSDCTFPRLAQARESLPHFFLHVNILPVIFPKSCY